MNTIPSAQLLCLWIAFTALAVIGISAVLVWAARSGQFAEQERARSLPLVSGVPTAAPTERRPPWVSAPLCRRPLLEGGALSPPRSRDNRPPVPDPTSDTHKDHTHDAH